jgi:hypothetical protein
VTEAREELIVIKGSPLKPDAKARCAMCGKSRDLGKIKSPGFNYGVVFCTECAGTWMDVLVASFTDGMFRLEDVIRDAGLR